MSKLLNLKSWLTLDDAAKYLSGMLNEEVSVVDLLQLAIESHLTLSAHFFGPWEARTAQLDLEDNTKLTIQDELVVLEGTYDLPLIGSTQSYIENMYQQLTRGSSLMSGSLDGFIVRSPTDKNYYASLQERTSEDIATVHTFRNEAGRP